MLLNHTVVKEEAGQDRLAHLACRLLKMFLPGRKKELTLFVVKSLGKEPLIILTNLPARHSRNSVLYVVKSRIIIWWIEDVIRPIKQSYRLGLMGCLTYLQLQALIAVVNAAAYFASAGLGLLMKLRVLIGCMLWVSKRVLGIPDI